MHVLLIKMSSMGDIIHTLPALTDAQSVIPHLTIDWVVEPAFADIPAWHPLVRKIIPVAWRQWRKNLFNRPHQKAMQEFFSTLRAEKYDLIIDAQGLLKSAIVAKIARGITHGADKKSARESFSSYFYTVKHALTSNQHAVTETRELFAKALQYDYKTMLLNYGINPGALPTLNFKTTSRYCVFLHGTTWESKHYPKIYWKQLLEKTNQEKIHVYLPWGNAAEKAAAEELAAALEHVSILPKLSIAQMATVLKNAAAVVGGDTGFTHLCAALSTPTISLYGPTDPSHIGAMGDNQIHLRAQFPCAPCYSKTCWYAKQHDSIISPTCYTTIGPDVVWEQLSKTVSPISHQHATTVHEKYF